MPYENVDGKISRLYVNSDSCNIRLDGHGERYFTLGQDHGNYPSIYSLLVAGMIHRNEVRLRLESYADGEPPSDVVRYIVVDQP
ncbi:MAG: hypothetical protein AAGD06_27005 [Acidobacteriota bacterium]